jgi:hypothetical protein
MFELSATATEEVQGTGSQYSGTIVDGTNVVPTTITDISEQLAEDATAFMVLADGKTIKAPVAAQRPLYKVVNNRTKHSPVSQTAMPALDNPSLSRTKLGVGEEADLYFKPDLPGNAKWHTTAGGFLNDNMPVRLTGKSWRRRASSPA